MHTQPPLPMEGNVVWAQTITAKKLQKSDGLCHFLAKNDETVSRWFRRF